MHSPAWNQIPFLLTTMQAVRRNGGIAATHLQPNTRKRWPAPHSRHLNPGKNGTNYTQGWVSLGADMNGTENISPTGIQSLNHPTRIEYLYRLRHPGCLSPESKQSIFCSMYRDETMVCTAVSAHSALTFYNGIWCLGRFLLYKADFMYSPETKRKNN
jgi:hypothetical protein